MEASGRQTGNLIDLTVEKYIFEYSYVHMQMPGMEMRRHYFQTVRKYLFSGQ